MEDVDKYAGLMEVAGNVLVMRDTAGIPTPDAKVSCGINDWMHIFVILKSFYILWNCCMNHV